MTLSMRGIFLPLFFCFSVLCGQNLHAADAQRIRLEGHLDEALLQAAQQSLEGLPDEVSILVLEVSSASGDLLKTLDFAKAVYAKKLDKGLRVVVYIDDSALGPAAVLPFLADEIASSLFVSWGDVPMSSEAVLPTNLLRSQVKSLIAPDHSQVALLQLLAEAMVDPAIAVVDDGGWRKKREDDAGSLAVLTPAEETLVLNQNQLTSLGLVAKGIPVRRFREGFAFFEAKQEDDAAAGTPIADMGGTLERRLAKHIRYSKQGPNTVGRILIDNRTQGITQATWIYVRAALEYYKLSKPTFIILELNTPGGEVFASQKISDALKEMDINYGIPVVAYINNWAISAGAMLAYSCRFIAIVKDASMGAAEPVLATGQEGQMQTASEKINSALRTDFANRAGFFDRNPDLAEAMVDKDIILVKRHGKVLRLDKEEQVRSTGPRPDEIITAKGKLLTLNADQMTQLGVADIFLEPTPVEPITELEREQGFWPAKKSRLFSHPFFAAIPDATIDPHEMNWQTHFFAFLATPAVASFLFLGMMLGFYMELNTPGFGLAGSIAIGCLFLITLSSFSVEAANMLELIIVLVGLVLIGVELFVLPGFGVVGALGVVLFIGGIFAMMLPNLGEVTFDFDSDTWNAAGEEFMLRLTWLTATFLVGIVSIGLLARYAAPKMPWLNKLILQGHEQTAEEGYVAGKLQEKLPELGDTGEVIATLRPAGKVMVGDEVYDAVSDGVFIEKGTKIIVRELRGNKLYVESTS